MVCAKCGASNTAADFCARCGTALPGGAQREMEAAAPPGASAKVPGITADDGSKPSVPTANAADGYPLASMGDRLLAVIFDTILIGVLFGVIGMWVAVRQGGVTASGFSFGGPMAATVIALTILAALLYYWLLEWLTGATLGKAMVGIQVRGQEGAPCGRKAALMRNVLRLIDGLVFYLVGFVIAILSKRRQRLGDHIASTVVVRHPLGRFGRGAVAALWVAAVGGGVFGAYSLHHGAPLSAEATASPAAPGPNPATVSTTAAGSVQTPAQTTGDLKIVNFAWTDGKDGPTHPAGSYKPGDDVFAKYDVVGFTTDAQGGIKVRLGATIADPSGAPLDKAWSDSVQGTLQSPSSPINGHYQFHLNRYDPGGTYTLTLTAHDAVRNVDAAVKPTLSVVAGATITPANRLEIRNFQFSTAEDGPPLNPAVFEGGQTVAFSYDVFGVKFNGDHVAFQTAFKLLGPDGKTLIDQPQWDNTDQDVVYHPPSFFVHYHGHVDLPADFPKGGYTEQFVISDNVANTTLNYAGKFTVK